MQDHACQTLIVISEEIIHPTVMPQETTPATFSAETKDIPVPCDESVRILTY